MALFEIIGSALLVYTVFTVAVYGVVVTALVFERRASPANAFYAMYMTGCLADAFSLVNVFFKYCALTGFMYADWLNSIISIHAMQSIVWGSALSQRLTVWMIAANRLTAICLPLQHSTIWNINAIRICTTIQLASLLIFGGFMAVSLNPYRTSSELGGTKITMNISAETQQMLYLSTTIFTTVNGVIVLVCYATMIVAMVMRKMFSQITYGNERNLFMIAFFVCTLEILSVVQQFASTQFKLSKDVMNIIYITGVVVYNSIPPYLLIIFSSSIRKRLILMLDLRLALSQTTQQRRRSTLVGPVIALTHRMAAPSLYSSNQSI